MSLEFSVGPTVGRESELEQFDDALASLDATTSACIAVEGEPGIGKTHLLAEVRNRAEEQGCLVLRGAATEFEREVPFGVWTDAMDAYVASQELDLYEHWSAELVAELGEIVPSSRRASERSPRAVADERYRTYRAARELLELLAQDRPLVVVLDDLHWGDEASIELVATLLRRGADAPVLLALAFRPRQAPARLSAALATSSARRIALEPLTEEQATALLADVDPGAAAAMYRHGGGNPLYLEQLRRAAGDGRLGAVPTERDDSVQVAGVAVPSAVAASLAGELASLPATELVLLRAAAVAGEPFEVDLATAIAELAPSNGLEALDGLLALDLVRTTQVPQRFTFRHPLVRRAVYESAPAGWRLGAHARAGSELAERGAPAAERAHHVEQYAGRGDEEAITLMLDAGAAASARAPAAAARWFEAALRLLPAVDVTRQVDVRVALASSLRSVGELDSSRNALLEALELLPADATAQRVELTAHCAAVEHWLGRHDAAHRRLTRAWEDLPERTTAESVVLEIELAVDGLYELDFAQAIEMAEVALATAREVGRPPLVAAAAAVLCLAETTAGRIELATTHLHEARQLIDGLSDAEIAPHLESLYHLAWAETYLERYEDAVAHADRGIAIARAFGEGRLLVPLTLAKNFPFEMQGRLREAIEFCEVALETARLSASPHELYRALFELGWTRYYAGDLSAAIAAHEESAAVDPRLAGGTIPNGGGGPGWGLGVAWLEAGEVDRARHLLLELVGEDVARTMPVERCFDWESLALLELAAGNVDAADAYARRAEEDAALLPLQLPAALAGRTRAAVLLARDEPLGGSSCRARVLRGRRLGRSAAAGGVLAGPGGTSTRSGRRASRRGRGAPRCGTRARRVWLGPSAGRDAPRASATRRASRATRAGRRGRQRCRLADQARAGDRPASSPIG